MDLALKAIYVFSLLTVLASTIEQKNADIQNSTESSCSLLKYIKIAHCSLTEDYLFCSRGISSEFIRSVQSSIRHLRIHEWPGKCIDLDVLQVYFPALKDLEFINCTHIEAFKGRFHSRSKIQVWSDYKNNTKKKAARIFRAARGTGGGPSSNIKLNDLEQRVMSIVGTRSATGIVEIPEIGLEEDIEQPLPLSDTNDCHTTTSQLHNPETYSTPEIINLPSTSAQPFPLYLSMPCELGSDTRAPAEVDNPDPVASQSQTETGLHVADSAPAARTPPLSRTSARRGLHPQSPTPLPLTPRRRRRGHGLSSPLRRRTRTQTQSELAREAFVRSDSEWRAFQQETERERNRLRELEIRSQERWQDLFAELLALGRRYLDNK